MALPTRNRGLLRISRRRVRLPIPAASKTDLPICGHLLSVFGATVTDQNRQNLLFSLVGYFSPNPLNTHRSTEAFDRRANVSHFFFLAGHFEAISLLQNRPDLSHRAERVGTCCLTRKPVSFAVLVVQIELRINVPRNPNRPSGNTLGPADRDKQRR